MGKPSLCLIFSILAFRSAAIDALELGISLVNDTSQVLSGGINQGAVTRTLGAASVQMPIADGWTVYMDALILRGEDGADDVGNLQAYSNIDEAEFSKVYELWAERRFDQDRIRVKFGRVDANTEFAFADRASEFIHSSMGVSPAIAFIPTYPSPALSVNAFFKLNAQSVGIGVYSGEGHEFDEQFYITQWQLGKAAFNVKLGAWHQTGNLIELSTNEPVTYQRGATGAYLVAEGDLEVPLLSGWFLQAAWSDDKVAEMDTHIGAGLTWTGLANRQEDAVGLGISYVTVSDELAASFGEKETAIEGYYRYQVTANIALKPDMQYILNPAADQSADDALIFTLRTEFTF